MSTVRELSKAITKVRQLRAVGGNTTPIAVEFGSRLGWRVPDGLDARERSWLLELCQLLDLNLPVR